MGWQLQSSVSPCLDFAHDGLYNPAPVSLEHMVLAPKPTIAKEALKGVWHRAGQVLLGRHRVALVRWLRGRRDLRRLAEADVVVVSFPKSGRTWLAVMLSHLFQTKYHLPDRLIIERDNLHRLNPAVPVFFFTHGRFVQDLRPIAGETSPYHDKAVIFLARHPADIAVSYYFQARNRIDPMMREVKRLPRQLDDVPLFEFVTSDAWGIPAIVRFLNSWAEGLRQHPRHVILRYEDLHAEPLAQLRRIAELLGETFTDEAYEAAVAFASFGRLQEKERENYFASRRLQPRDAADPGSFKVRRGKVGGYRDDFTDEEIAVIDRQVSSLLDPAFGYNPAAASDRFTPVRSQA